MRVSSLSLALLLVPLLFQAACGEKNSVGPRPGPSEDQPDAPEVVLLHPNGSETLTDEVTITWNAVDPDTGETELLAVDLDYSADNGSTWAVIDTDRMNGGAYLWDISGLPDGGDYLVRVTVTDSTGLSDSDRSDARFAIENEIFLTDLTGKRWDITHAVKVYGMRPENFRYGLGPNAIRPITDPEMISPGEPGYPDDTATLDIIGTNIAGDARAYPVHPLGGHEVVDDVVGGEPVAVIY
jgi:hypothetical protein